MYRILWFLTWIFFRIFYPTKIVGRENIVKGGAILITNHLSNVDPLLIISYNRRKVYSLGKIELFNTKFKAWFFKSVYVIPIDRKTPSVNSIKTSLKVLKSGNLLSMFPEGTRNKTDEDLQDIKGGCCMLAIKAKVPIIPINIKKKPKLFRRNKIIIGKPFELKDFYDQKLNSDVLDKASEIVYEELKKIYEEN